MADHGRHAWRTVPGADIAFLLNLPAVKRQLAASTEREIDPDTELDAILAAVKEVIDRLPQPNSAIAADQFGFSDPDPEKARTKVAREAAAADKFPVDPRTYTKPVAKYGGLSRRDYIIGLVAQGLCLPSDPSPDTSEPPVISSPQPADQRVPSRRSVALALGGLLACATAAAAALGAFAGGTHRPHATGHPSQAPSRQTTPAPLLNSSASCSSFAAAVQERPRTIDVDSPGQLAGGEGLVGRVTPNGTYGHLLEVKQDDIVELSIRLHNTEFGSVSDVVVAVGVRQEQPRCVRLMAVAHSSSAPVALGPLILKSLSDAPPRLKYIPGSTRLLTQSGKELVHLPDGAMGAGAAIPYQIPAGSQDYFMNFGIKIE